jgi:AcrR family transcriptional regulator
VPVARTKVDRQAKIEEILDAARRRLLAGGYDAMSVAAISRELKIAQNSVYWYFPSKDDLFAAAFRRIIERLVTAKPPARRGRVARVVWVTDQMAEFAPLRAALRRRAAHCAAAARLESDLDGWIRRLLLGETESPRDREDATVAGDAFLATVEGALALDVPAPERQRLIAFAYERLVGSAGEGSWPAASDRERRYR